jgi:hypothetical protein
VRSNTATSGLGAPRIIRMKCRTSLVFRLKTTPHRHVKMKPGFRFLRSARKSRHDACRTRLQRYWCCKLHSSLMISR